MKSPLLIGVSVLPYSIWAAAQQPTSYDHLMYPQAQVEQANRAGAESEETEDPSIFQFVGAFQILNNYIKTNFHKESEKGKIATLSTTHKLVAAIRSKLGSAVFQREKNSVLCEVDKLIGEAQTVVKKNKGDLTKLVIRLIAWQTYIDQHLQLREALGKTTNFKGTPHPVDFENDRTVWPDLTTREKNAEKLVECLDFCKSDVRVANREQQDLEAMCANYDNTDVAVIDRHTKRLEKVYLAFQRIDKVRTLLTINKGLIQVEAIEQILSSMETEPNIHQFVAKISDLEECVAFLIGIEKIKSTLPFDRMQDVARRVREINSWIQGIDPTTNTVVQKTALEYISGVKAFLDQYLKKLSFYHNATNIIEMLDSAPPSKAHNPAAKLRDLFFNYQCQAWDCLHKGKLCIRIAGYKLIVRNPQQVQEAFSNFNARVNLQMQLIAREITRVKKKGTLVTAFPADYVWFKELATKILSFFSQNSYGLYLDMEAFERLYTTPIDQKTLIGNLEKAYKIPSGDITSISIEQSPLITFYIFQYYLQQDSHTQPEEGKMESLFFASLLGVADKDDILDVEKVSRAANVIGNSRGLDTEECANASNALGELVLRKTYQGNAIGFLQEKSKQNPDSQKLLKFLKGCWSSLDHSEPLFVQSSRYAEDGDHMSVSHLWQFDQQRVGLSRVYFNLIPVDKGVVRQAAIDLGPALNVLSNDEMYRELVLDNYALFLQIANSKGYNRFPDAYSKKDELGTTLDAHFDCYEDQNLDQNGRVKQHIWLHKELPISVRVKKSGEVTIGLVAIPRVRPDNHTMQNILSFQRREFAKVGLQKDAGMCLLMPGFKELTLHNQPRLEYHETWDEDLSPLVHGNIKDYVETLDLAHFSWKV